MIPSTRERRATAARIVLHRPDLGAAEAEAAADAVRSGRIDGGGPQLARAEALLRERTVAPNVLCTTSCTHALELLLMAHGVGVGDEVIVPAYTFPATATCVVRQGARVVFADSLPDDPNIDPADVERRVTPRTRAIILLHYGGVPCDVARIRAALGDRRILVLEDAAHALDARVEGAACGTLGDGGCFSFHATKNITCGEGGALVLKDAAILERALVAREIGTDRARYRAGGVERYTWRGAGSSFLPSDILMAILVVQLAKADMITRERRRVFSGYLERLGHLGQSGRIHLPHVQGGSECSGHIFHVLLADRRDRDHVRSRLDEAGIDSASHYDALDTTPFGASLVPAGAPRCERAAATAARLLRLPIHPGITSDDLDRICAVLEAAVR